jgi:hypothetical protein
MANQLQTSQPRQAGESEPSWLLRIMNAIIADIKYIASLFNKTYSGIFINGDGDTVTVDKGLIISVESPPLPLRLTWDDIGNALYTTVGDYNALFGSDFTTLTVDGNDQLLSGNSTTFAIPAEAFYENNNIVAINDEAESCTSVGEYAFQGCTAFTTVTLNACTTVGERSFQVCTALTTATFPACTSVGVAAFNNCTSLTTVTLPLCADLGSTTGDDNVFFGISGNTITLTIPISRETCNAGNPDGDIEYLAANNTATINYV